MAQPGAPPEARVAGLRRASWTRRSFDPRLVGRGVINVTGAPPRDSARPERRASDRLIVALDLPTLGEAARLVDALAPYVGWFKIGSELFTAAGPEAVTLVLARDRNVFLDLKFHDIPHPVAAAVAAAARLGVMMMNIHVAAGDEAMREAGHALAASFPPDNPHSSATNTSRETQ